MPKLVHLKNLQLQEKSVFLQKWIFEYSRQTFSFVQTAACHFHSGKTYANFSLFIEDDEENIPSTEKRRCKFD